MKKIKKLTPNEVFVFGSNADGRHLMGAARMAWKKFGAVWGEGQGHHGQSYAINTMSGIDQMSSEIATFVDYAKTKPKLTFLVTEIGCGIAGYKPDQIGPMFQDVPPNVELPANFR